MTTRPKFISPAAAFHENRPAQATGYPQAFLQGTKFAEQFISYLKIQPSWATETALAAIASAIDYTDQSETAIGYRSGFFCQLSRLMCAAVHIPKAVNGMKALEFPAIPSVKPRRAINRHVEH